MAQQTLRFGVGSPEGHHSRVWRLWVPRGKSDLYVSSRRVSSSVKVSLHEPGPSRFALTTEWVRHFGFQAPVGRDRRLAVEWNRPRPRPPNVVARPLAIIVPSDEVRPRQAREDASTLWTQAPQPGNAVHFDIVYIPEGASVSGHPGQRSMGTGLVGKVLLENGQQVFITSIERPILPPLQEQIDRLRRAQIRDASGALVLKTGMLAFGIEPNPDAQDGTEIGMLLDVTRD